VPQEKEEKMQYCLVSFPALVLHISEKCSGVNSGLDPE
jgi:hypothetical protein